jgi:hypothetical protein
MAADPVYFPIGPFTTHTKTTTTNTSTFPLYPNGHEFSVTYDKAGVMTVSTDSDRPSADEIIDLYARLLAAKRRG